MGRLTVISGLGAKAPAAFLIETDGRRILLDLGSGPDLGAEPDLGRIGGPVDAVLLSHAHGDHAGALSRRGEIGDPAVYATGPTAALTGVAARSLPLRGTTDVLGLAVTTGRTGHAPGGVWLHLAIGDGVFYAGDMAFGSCLYPVDVPPAAGLATVDASYGEDDTPICAAHASFGQALDAATGPVLLPVPTDGRGPEIALWLKRRQDRWPRIDEPLRRLAARLASDWSDCVAPDATEALAALAREAPEADRPDGVLLAASPQLDGGRSADLADAVLEAGGSILLSGHVATGRRAARLVADRRATFCRWPVHPRLSDNARLVRHLGARRVLPAFGSIDDPEAWTEAFRAARVLLAPDVAL